MKRAFDIAASAAGLVLLSPLMLLVALYVLVRLRRPLLFRQERPGLHGRPFTIVKFRTMNNRRDNEGRLLPDEQRLGRFGAFLRSTSLDELPELWNVLKGEMSMVGPRPLLTQYLPLYSERQMRRHEVRPGITGWAQVNGRNDLPWPERLEMDVWYVENRSSRLDMKILGMTIGKAVSREGISQQGQATVEYFQGNEP